MPPPPKPEGMSGAYIQTTYDPQYESRPGDYIWDDDKQVMVDSGSVTSHYQEPVWDELTQQWIIPGAQDPVADAGMLGTAHGMARGYGAQRLSAAQQYAEATRQGQSAALAQQRLGMGQGLQQQRMAANQGGLQARAAMYQGARQAEQAIAQESRRRAQEQMAAEGLLGQAQAGQAQQAMSEADQITQLYGMEYGREQGEITGDVATAQAKKDAEIDMEGIALAAGGATLGAMSDRRLKRRLRSDRLNEDALLRALMEADRG